MDETMYQKLSDKWKAQGRQFDDWRIALVREAHRLRNDVASVLGAPDKWMSLDKREERRYVEVIDLSTKERSPAASFSRDAITEDGELVFGISFTFEHAPNSYPKSLYHIAMAVRYKDGVPEFCQWDTRENDPMGGSAWQRDVKKVVDEILAILEKQFSLDPFQGLSIKSAIGFILAE